MNRSTNFYDQSLLRVLTNRLWYTWWDLKIYSWLIVGVFSITIKRNCTLGCHDKKLSQNLSYVFLLDWHGQCAWEIYLDMRSSCTCIV